MITLTVMKTRVRASAVALIYVITLWGLLTWLGLHWHLQGQFWESLGVGFVSMLLMVFADFGHPFGHVLSARFARAPMDEIVISGDMPRTLYQNNKVSPRVHKLRAIGGPLFNLLGLLLSAAIFVVATGWNLGMEWAAWSALAHGLMLIMSMAPIPVVDGGTILMWTLVEAGHTTADAAKILRRVDLGIGVLFVLAAVVFLAQRALIPAILATAVGAIFVWWGVRRA
jgi:hypothetical protein